MENSFVQFLFGLLAHSPVLLVYFVGLVLALVWMGRAPWACGLAIAGLGMLLLIDVVMAAAYVWLPRMWFEQFGNSAETAGWFFRGLHFVHSLIGAAGLLLIVLAVFTGRAKSPQSIKTP
jgi:hypothetical protein